jgi:hypothetical protein
MVGEGMKQKTNGVGGERATGHLRPFDRVPGKPSLPRWTRASLISSPLPTLQNMSRPMLTSLRDRGTTDKAIREARPRQVLDRRRRRPTSNEHTNLTVAETAGCVMTLTVSEAKIVYRTVCFVVGQSHFRRLSVHFGRGS